jgi:8-oxo-dGTP pyrophosphatase MutT (NUDIX family)
MHSELEPLDGLRTAAVLVPVLRDDAGRLRLLLVVRFDDGGLHGGQLGLPGGRPEPHDTDLRMTALREAQEEIGLDADAVEVLAELPALETRVTGWRVHPVVGRVPWRTDWVLQDREIVGGFTPTVSELADPNARRTLPFTSIRHTEPLLVEGIDLEGHILWGMTLRLLDQVVPRLLAGEWTIR